MRPRIPVGEKWNILAKIIGADSLKKFMYMGDVGDVFKFKHIDTRQYLNIDVHGRLYRYVDMEYQEIKGEGSINECLSSCLFNE